MAQIVNRNGKEYTFPDNYTQEQIDAHIDKLEGKKTEEDTEEKTGEERGLLTDVPVQALGGVFDAGKSALNLMEGIGADLKRRTGHGGFTFGENAHNGIVQYHTYAQSVFLSIL